MNQKTRPEGAENAAARIGFEILERQDELQVVTGIVMDPENVDAFGNQIPDRDLIERIAFGFMEQFQRIGTDHARQSAEGPTLVNPQLVVVESFIARTEQKIGNAIAPRGAWILSVRVLDSEVWERVKRGELNGFSLEGVFVRVKIEQSKHPKKKKRKAA